MEFSHVLPHRGCGSRPLVPIGRVLRKIIGVDLVGAVIAGEKDTGSGIAHDLVHGLSVARARRPPVVTSVCSEFRPRSYTIQNVPKLLTVIMGNSRGQPLDLLFRRGSFRWSPKEYSMRGIEQSRRAVGFFPFSPGPEMALRLEDRIRELCAKAVATPASS